MIKKSRRIQYGVVAMLFMVASIATTITFAPQTSALAGDGDDDNPWQITSCVDLQELNTNTSYRGDEFVLTQDIDCQGVDFPRIHFSNNLSFRGVFDGAGHTIRNVAVNNSVSSWNGIFGHLDGAVIRDLTLENVTASGEHTVGTLAGYVSGGTYVENVNVMGGTVTGIGDTQGYFGGLFGEMNGSELFNVIVDVDVIAPNTGPVGGLIGNVYGDGLIGQAAALGNVEGFEAVGGLVGSIWNSAIDKSFATGNVIAHAGQGGGLVGAAGNTSIIGTYARGSVTGSGYLGGHTGSAEADTVIGWAYATGLVTPQGESVGGGLVGAADDLAVVQSDSFWDIQTTGMINSAGAGEVGKTTAEMKEMDTYVPFGWNFEDYWFQGDDVNDGYLCQIWYQVCYDAFMGGGNNGGGSSDLPNNGDGNNDGEIDSEQNNVVTILSPISSKYVTVAVDESCTLSDVSIANASSHSVKDDSAYAYQSGFVNFTATGCDEDVANVKLYYHGVSPTGVIARKYNPITSEYFTISQASIVAAPAPLSGTLVSYTIVDNGELDVDPADGVIVDPVGLAAVNVGVPNTGLLKHNVLVPVLAGITGLAILAGLAVVVRTKTQTSTRSQK